ncbi:MAG TPA: efflux RND transporter periplasmic adaptor subunit [Tepidisphaeraceae bacterium]|nr:efflux RND transporter periplasmic adaptor subunit [Tepidisphaeraceae bacterium]
MKKLILVILIVAVATGLYAWYAKDRSAAATSQPTPTATVERGNIFQAVAATGRVVSNLDVDIKCQASGRVTQLPFDISQSVKKDQLLAQLDPIDEKHIYDEAKVTLDSAKAKYEQAKQNLDVAKQNIVTSQLRADADLASAKSKASDARAKAKRRKELLDQKLTSQEDFDTAETTAEQAEADVKTAEAEQEDIKAQQIGLDVKQQDIAVADAQVQADQIALDNAKQQMDYTTVNAPMDGVVSALDVQIGSIIASGTGGFSGGTTLMTLSDLSHIFILANVDESDIGQVHLDSSCLITADAFPGKHFHGKVVRIATKGVNTSNVVTFEVKIEITGENRTLLKPEMTTNLQIISAQKDDVLIVPTQAVTRKDRHTTIATVMLPGGKQEDRTVEIGLSDGENYEIVSGLNEGDTVLVHKDETNSKWNGGRGPSVGMMGMGGSSHHGGSH